MFRQPDQPPEVNIDQILERVRSFFGRFKLGGGGNLFAYAVFAIVGVALVVWLATGVYTVQPGEQAALRMLGKFDSIQGPGLNWFPPAPIGTKNIVSVEEIRRLELGFRGGQTVPSEALMITGDENIVDAQLLVQYDIKDLESFLFRAADPEGIILKSAAESALRLVVGQRNIDDILTVEKEAIQDETKQLLQTLLDLYQTGIRVREVKLQNVLAPIQVQDAFDDVVRAKEDKERAINLAQAYREDIVPRARGEAARLLQGAEGFRAERINAATGQAARFLSVLEEFEKAPEVTKQRLYLEAMEEVLPGVTKFIVATDAGGNVLQFLQLNGASPVPFQPQAAPSQPAPTQSDDDSGP